MRIREKAEEVVSAIGEPLLERITWNPRKDLATTDELVDAAIGGVLLSAMMSGGEALIDNAYQLAETQKNASGEAGSARKTRIKADTDIEAENISRGKAAIDRLFREAKTADDPEALTAEGAMYRSDLGPIDFKWGRPGTGQKFKHGFGLAHLFAKRNAEAGNGWEVANKMAEVIAKATDVDIQRSNDGQSEVYNARLYYDGYTAVLVKNPDSNHWLLTGWKDKMKTAASATGEGYDSSGATAATPTPTRRDGGYAAASRGSIPSGEQIVNIPSYAEMMRQLKPNAPSSYADAFRQMQPQKPPSATPYADLFHKFLEEYGGTREP